MAALPAEDRAKLKPFNVLLILDDVVGAIRKAENNPLT